MRPQPLRRHAKRSGRALRSCWPIRIGFRTCIARARQRNGCVELLERRALGPGDFYALIPPSNDIHRVRTTSVETSVSIHLLTNDTGCVWRHAYDPESGQRAPFRSGYVNVPCDDAHYA